MKSAHTYCRHNEIWPDFLPSVVQILVSSENIEKYFLINYVSMCVSVHEFVLRNAVSTEDKKRTSIPWS